MTSPKEISQIIKTQIENYKSRVQMEETGKVILVGDGIAQVYGLKNCMANELLEFEGGSFGVAQNLEEETDRQLLNTAIAKLGKREQQIMALRFGLGGVQELTQKEVADRLGISQSYISRLEKKIISRLKKEILKLS